MTGKISIDGLWAALTYEADGQEQIVTFHGYAVVAADPERLPMVRQIAASISMSKGIDISLVRFTGREVVERWGRNDG